LNLKLGLFRFFDRRRFWAGVEMTVGVVVVVVVVVVVQGK